MGSGVCTSIGCFLAREGGLVSFPLVTLAGLVDGINPCAIGMIIFLLGYLIVFAQKPQKVLPLGLAYIVTVYLTYLTIGFFLFRLATILSFNQWTQALERVLGGGLLLAGIINIKDFFAPKLPLHLEIPQKSRKQLFSLIEKVSLPAVIILAVLVTLFETPCSLPVYVGTITILSHSNLPKLEVLGYFLYYNFLFVLPLIVILFLIWKGKQLVELKEWEHKHKGKMKLSLGALLVLMSFYLLFF